jgi:hypothetical protein
LRIGVAIKKGDKMREIKYIIVRDKINNKIRHFKSEWLHHYTIGRDNGYDSNEILEAGIVLEGTLFILECKILEHLRRIAGKYIGNSLYQDIRLAQWLKGRELESSLYYTKKPIGVLGEGD